MLPADVLDLAHLHQLRQQQLAYAATISVTKAWDRLSPTDVQGSWDQVVGPAITTLVTHAQFEAARGSQDYVSRTAELEGGVPDPSGTVPPSAFAGVASDGRPLESLLSYPLFQVQAFVSNGMSTLDALGIGSRHLNRIVATQVQDSARISTGVGIVNDRSVTGYVRVVSAGACSRCTILAGKWYAYNSGFLRHPHCGCINAPTRGHVEPQSPKSLFDAMSPEQRRKAGWSQADIKAIEDGGDLYQVTNAKRDLRSVSVAGHELQTTLQGATRRGFAGKRLGAARGKAAIRLTPESIYKIAGNDRDQAIRLLRSHGYIIGDARSVTATVTKATTVRAAESIAVAAPTSYAEKIAAAATERDALASAKAALGRTTAGMARMSRVQANAMREYVSSGYYAINGQLRRDAVDAREQASIDRIDQVMAQATLDRDIATWRGITNAGKLFGDRMAADLSGVEWTEKAYTSTSASENVARTFTYQSGQVLMRLLVPKGVSAIRLSGMGVGGQAEMMLQRGLRFRVVADRGISPQGFRLLDVEVVR